MNKKTIIFYVLMVGAVLWSIDYLVLLVLQ